MRARNLLLLAGAMFALSINLHCGEPGAPLPDSPGATLAREPVPRSRLWSKENLWAFGINAGLRGVDAGLTCYGLGNGGREVWLPSQSCAGTAVMILSAVPLQVAGVWILQRTGHRKLARVVAWGVPAADAAAVAYSWKNWNNRKGEK